MATNVYIEYDGNSIITSINNRKSYFDICNTELKTFLDTKCECSSYVSLNVFTDTLDKILEESDGESQDLIQLKSLLEELYYSNVIMTTVNKEGTILSISVGNIDIDIVKFQTFIQDNYGVTIDKRSNTTASYIWKFLHRYEYVYINRVHNGEVYESPGNLAAFRSDLIYHTEKCYKSRRLLN